MVADDPRCPIPPPLALPSGKEPMRDQSEASQRTPYKNVPIDDAIKAVHLLLMNLTYMVSYLVCLSVDEETQRLIDKSTIDTEKEVSSLLRSEPDVCLFPRSFCTTPSSSQAQCQDSFQSPQPVDSKKGKDC